MGLAEPRKRIKLSHDPNNTAWTSTPSFGSVLMQKSGWKPGTALGASSVPIPVSQSTASQVKITVKDNTLGLGASLKSRDVENQRTGLDAFQGLLGRLNAKDEKALKVVEEKIENRKLEMFARGRWGGMTFVRGGLLVQEDPRTQVVKAEEVVDKEARAAKEEDSEDETQSLQKAISSNPRSKPKKQPNETPEQRATRKTAEALYKQDKKARKEARRLKKALKESQRSSKSAKSTSTPIISTTNTATTSASETPDLTDFTEASTGTSTPVAIVEGTSSPGVSVTSVTQTRLKNGRHLLRGRNIQAKRMAFSDSRGLDQIFMRRAETGQEV